MADHNDPNAVNSIFSDIDVSAADLYDIFGFPSDDAAGGEKVVIALTFAAVPQTGVFDGDMLYRIQIAPDRRLERSGKDDGSLEGFLAYLEGVKDKYLSVLQPSEVRITIDHNRRANIRFLNFPGGSFSAVVETNQAVTLQSPGGHAIKAFVGGRDDAFFNDLPGFFRSINYAPQFYHVPHAMPDLRELKIPKTFLELEGNDLFNYDPDQPEWGHGIKRELPPGPLTWSGNRFRKDENGNFRFVYSGKDARAGQNCNAIILELPLTFLTERPSEHRVVNTWGESWVLKAAAKVETIPDHPLWIEHPHVLLTTLALDEELKKYKLVDTDGQAFADAALSEREDNRQLGANNFWLAPHFIRRLGHLGWGFGPSITALGLASAFDHDNSPVSVHRTYSHVMDAFPRVRKILFQELNMPDDSWNRKGLPIALRRPVDIFIPNVNSIDMDTTGTWPFGRRLEDQVATRFLSVFLDMGATLNGKRYHVELLNDPTLWNSAPIEPKTPPNPLKNDKAFLPDFPYLLPRCAASRPGNRPTKYIASIGSADPLAMPTDPERVTLYVYRLYQRAAIAGDSAQLSAVERTINRAIPLLANPSDLYLLKANTAFKLHKLSDVEAALRAVPSVYDSNEGRLIRADLDFQHGRYREAKRGYLGVLQAERSWGAVARLAYFYGKRGDVAGADHLYEEAEDQLTAKEMRSYAWLEVQRGFLAFAHGRYGEARLHYGQADAAYPGYWLVDEHVAELLGAEGHYGQAIEILERIISTRDRPDLLQAIGELYAIAGQAERARDCHEKALDGYLQSAQRGEVLYYHHLADYYADVAKDGAQAVTWARADLQLRENYSTQAALAWAFYRGRQFGEACNWIDRALASGAVEAHLFFRTGMIYTCANSIDDGRNYMERATRLNPSVEKFHLHH